MKRTLWIAILIALVLATSGCAVGREAATPPMGFYPSEPEFQPAIGAAEVPVAEERAYYSDASAALPENDVERMVIRTADLDLVVPETEQALEQITELAEGLGGYVVSLNTYQYEQGVQGNVTLRIPAESFDAALTQLKALATTVRHETVSGQDVTEEYVDLESRLRHLRAKEDQLLEFLDQAEDTEAVLAVYEQLSATQEEIERVTGRMQYLENQTSLATISVRLTPDALAQPLEVGGWNLPGTVRDAVEALLSAVEFVVKAAIYLVIFVLPVLVMLAAPVVGLILLIRWLVRRRRKARASS